MSKITSISYEKVLHTIVVSNVLVVKAPTHIKLVLKEIVSFKRVVEVENVGV